MWTFRVYSFTHLMTMKLSILPCTEKLELVLFTAPKTWDDSDKDSKNRKWSHLPRKSVRGIYGKRSMGERFTKKVSFEFRVKEWRNDGWGEWRREGWIDVSIKRWNWFTKWKWKLIPEMRRGIQKRPICDLKGRGGRWTSKCDNIRGASIIVSLKRDEIM